MQETNPTRTSVNSTFPLQVSRCVNAPLSNRRYNYIPVAYLFLGGIAESDSTAYCDTYYRSVVCMSSVTLMYPAKAKPLDGMRYHLVGTHVWSLITLCWTGARSLMGSEDLGVGPPSSQRCPVAVLRWGQGAQAPQILPRPPIFWTHCYWLN